MKICPSCGYENDPTRVFCQSCGVRLPAEASTSQAPPAPVAGSAHTAETASTTRGPKANTGAAARKKEKESFGVSAVSFCFDLVVVALLAAVFAALVLILRPPANLPEPPPPSATLEVNLLEGLQATSSAPGARKFSVTGDQISRYLSTTLRAGGGAEYQLKFSGAAVRLEPEVAQLFATWSIFRLPIVWTAWLRPVASDSGSTLHLENLWIGSLPIPAAAAPFMAGPLNQLANALEQERSLVQQARTIVITPEAVRLEFLGAARQAP